MSLKFISSLLNLIKKNFILSENSCFYDNNNIITIDYANYFSILDDIISDNLKLKGFELYHVEGSKKLLQNTICITIYYLESINQNFVTKQLTISINFANSGAYFKILCGRQISFFSVYMGIKPDKKIIMQEFIALKGIRDESLTSRNQNPDQSISKPKQQKTAISRFFQRLSCCSSNQVSDVSPGFHTSRPSLV